MKERYAETERKLKAASALFREIRVALRTGDGDLVAELGSQLDGLLGFRSDVVAELSEELRPGGALHGAALEFARERDMTARLVHRLRVINDDLAEAVGLGRPDGVRPDGRYSKGLPGELLDIRV